jgi:hypothetical protein
MAPIRFFQSFSRLFSRFSPVWGGEAAIFFLKIAAPP